MLFQPIRKLRLAMKNLFLLYLRLCQYGINIHHHPPTSDLKLPIPGLSLMQAAPVFKKILASAFALRITPMQHRDFALTLAGRRDAGSTCLPAM